MARFNVRGFQRPDAKTRWEIYEIMTKVLGQQEAADQARVQEGLLPGDVEFMPVPFAQPSAIPASVPKLASLAIRDVRCPKCNRLAVRASGHVEAKCERCKTTFEAA